MTSMSALILVLFLFLDVKHLYDVKGSEKRREKKEKRTTKDTFTASSITTARKRKLMLQKSLPYLQISKSLLVFVV
jgi:hypothetical protein